MMQRFLSRRNLLLIAGLWVLADQLTKFWANNALVYGELRPVLPCFDLLLSYNRGAAFSFLHDSSGWQRWLLSAISLGVSIFLFRWLMKIDAGGQGTSGSWQRLALAFILGGAVGNLIDRALAGYVIDFISLYWGPYRFATFNVADAAISAGAAMLVVEILLQSVSGRRTEHNGQN